MDLASKPATVGFNVGCQCSMLATAHDINITLVCPPGLVGGCIIMRRHRQLHGPFEAGFRHGGSAGRGNGSVEMPQAGLTTIKALALRDAVAHGPEQSLA